MRIQRKNGLRDSCLKWIAQPIAIVRASLTARRAEVVGRVARPQPSAATGCSVTSATYASSSVGSRVVTRPSETPCSRSRIAWVGSWPSAAWTTTTCAWSWSSTATEVTPSIARSASTAPSPMP